MMNDYEGYASKQKEWKPSPVPSHLQKHQKSKEEKKVSKGTRNRMGSGIDMRHRNSDKRGSYKSNLFLLKDLNAQEEYGKDGKRGKGRCNKRESYG